MNCTWEHVPYIVYWVIDMLPTLTLMSKIQNKNVEQPTPYSIIPCNIIPKLNIFFILYFSNKKFISLKNENGK